MHRLCRFTFAFLIGGMALAMTGCPEQAPTVPTDSVASSSSVVDFDSHPSVEDQRALLEEAEQQAQATEQAARERDLSHLAKQSQGTFVMETENAISDAEFRIHELNKKVDNLEGDERRKLEDTIEQMEEALERVVDALTKVRTADELEWEDYRQEVEQSIFDLESIREPFES